MMLPQLHCLLTVMAATVSCTTASMFDFIPRDVIQNVGEYFFIGIPMNWTESMLLCQSSDAHLVIIDSVAEAASVKQIMTKHGATFIHLGFHDQFIEGKYNTVLGQPIDAPCTTGNEWAARSPKGGTTYNCGGFSEAGFTDTKCGDNQVFICELNTPGAGMGPRGYTLIPHHGYYKYYGNLTSWVIADETCRQEGAHLVILNSQREADALKTAFSPIPTLTFHVGVHRYYGGNENFVTVMGGSLRNTGYRTWISGYPFDSYINRPFVFYYVGSYNEMPGLATHNITSPFICEHDLIV